MNRVPAFRRSGERVWPALWALLALALAMMACSLPSVIERTVLASESTPTPVAPVATPGTLPVLTLTPDQGSAGNQVTVTGEHWQPGGTVLLRFENPTTGEGQQAVYASVSVTPAGTFVALITIPSDLPWPDLQVVQVRAWSATTGESAVALFRLNGAIVIPGVITPTLTSTVTPSPTEEAPLLTETPTPTPPEPPVVVVPTLEPGQGVPYGTVIASNLNMRAGPSVYYGLIAVLPGGTEFIVLGQNVYGDWLYVRLNNGLVGWLYRTFTDYQDPAPVIIVPEPPPPPPPPPPPTAIPVPTATPLPVITEWRGEYFANPDLAGGPALVRNDPAIGFDWGLGAPAPGLPADNFSVRWTRTMPFPSGLYRFHAVVDDGVRVFVDGRTIIDQWTDGSRREVTADTWIDNGDRNLRVEYYERYGDAYIVVWWEKLQTYPDWKGEYWNNTALSGDPALVRNDVSVNFDWGYGSPAPQIQSDYFSARWTRSQYFDPHTYRFHVVMDDGARLWVDNQLIIDQWSDGSAREVTADLTLAGGNHPVRVEYYEKTGAARIQFWWEAITPSYPDWKGEYFTNRDLSGSPSMVRNDPAIDFDWGTGSPAPNVPADHFSVRWNRWFNFSSGIYRLYAQSDDGIRVYVDGQIQIDQWHDSVGNQVYTGDETLVGPHWITVEYYENAGDAYVKFWFVQISGPTPTQTFTSTPTKTATPTRTPSPTQTPTLTRTPTATPTASPTRTPTPTSTPTASPTASPTGTLTPTSTPTASPTGTLTPTSTPTGTLTPTPTPTASPTGTLTPTATATASPTGTLSATPTGTDTAPPSSTPTNTPTGGPTGSAPALATATSTSRARRTATRTPPATSTATDTPEPTETAAPTATSTITDTVEPTDTPTPIASQRPLVILPRPVTVAPVRPLPQRTLQPVVKPTATPTVEPTDTEQPAGVGIGAEPANGSAPAGEPTVAPSATRRARASATPRPTRVTPAPAGPARRVPSPVLPLLRLNEVMTNPAQTTGVAGETVRPGDQWMELFNPGEVPVNLWGWSLVAGSRTNARVYTFPSELIIQPGEYLVLYGWQTGLALQAKGDVLLLVAPGATVADSVILPPLDPGTSYSRDRGGVWHDDWAPSPGALNVRPRVPED